MTPASPIGAPTRLAAIGSAVLRSVSVLANNHSAASAASSSRTIADTERVPSVERPRRAFIPAQQQRHDHERGARKREQLAAAHLAQPHAATPTWRSAANSVLRSRKAIVVGPTPPGHRRDRRGDLRHRVEVHVADQAALVLCLLGRQPADAHVDHHRARLDELARRSSAGARPRRSARPRARTPPRGRGCANGRSSPSRSRPSSSWAIGLPNRFERPTTTASAPSSTTPVFASSSITPSGVHDRSPGRPSASSPALTGVRPSTSLSGSTSAGQGRPVEVRRERAAAAGCR